MRSRGFTLVELLVVVTIAAILVAAVSYTHLTLPTTILV